MISESATERDARQRTTLERLLSEKNLGRHATFFETGEGVYLPDGLEKMTGYVIDAQGDAHWFVLDWDTERQVAALTTFRRADISTHWPSQAEYRRAREMVGLSD
jgi:hypothetical protein